MKKVVFLLAFVFCNYGLFAQDETIPQTKFFTGGNFGLTFGRYTVINLSPQIGYRFNRFVAAGMGLNLQYASEKEKDMSGNDYSKTSQGITGLGLFGRFYPVQSIFLQVQPEGNYIFGRIKYYQPTVQTFKLDTEIVPSFLVGGGYSMPAGRGQFLTTVLFDVLQRPNSPYGNQPIVNVGYNFSF
jgi:hypothetical protein